MRGAALAMGLSLAFLVEPETIEGLLIIKSLNWSFSLTCIFSSASYFFMSSSVTYLICISIMRDLSSITAISS
jgi:hypothetical protein